MRTVRAKLNAAWLHLTAKPRTLVAQFHAIKEFPAPPTGTAAPASHVVTAYASTGPLGWLGRIRVLFGWSVNFRVLIYASEPNTMRRALVSTAVQPSKAP